jgi:hypothetical protein
MLRAMHRRRGLLTIAVALAATACGSATSGGTPSSTPARTAGTAALESPSASATVPSFSLIPGPAGPTGAPGLSGYEIQHNQIIIQPTNVNLPANSLQEVTATCSPSKKVLGGSGDLRVVSGMIIERPLLASQPHNDNGWTAIANIDSADPKGSLKFRIDVWAICAYVG